MALRCLIVDDNAAFLREAALLLERDGLVIAGVASNTREALERAQELQPDLALVDVSLGSESGLELARQLIDAGAFTVILTSTHAETDLTELIEDAQVAGFVPKTDLSARAIRRLLNVI